MSLLGPQNTFLFLFYSGMHAARQTAWHGIGHGVWHFHVFGIAIGAVWLSINIFPVAVDVAIFRST